MSSSVYPDNKPLFLQIKEKIEDQIVNDQLLEGEQVPSTTQLSSFYKINHITVLKGINLLVESGLIFKKRGVGMFVAEGAKEQLLRTRKNAFADDYVVPMVQEADKLGLSTEDLFEIITQVKERDAHES
ncbi:MULTISPECIES: GntR family transcriptional regulator [Paenibacillus]|uniref:GntR family transcriptional regulator n=1 Tax=Paenibacillus TaxID=44249 RepID=UPI000593CB94|nr:MULTISPECIES: GntR family transcriptional regulator [Paenibacillus]MCM3495853.1 GntR family transcriptional regulator [Paenibacillus lactis]HAG00238.1 GntR family transcriptional regulator [Paenibacillus lactis]